MDQEINYEPGHYEITIFTTPVIFRKVDLYPNTKARIEIPNPRYVRLIDANTIKEAYLYIAHGDSIFRQEELPLSDSENIQQFQINPGEYKVYIFFKSDTLGNNYKFLKFSIRSNKITELELK